MKKFNEIINEKTVKDIIIAAELNASSDRVKKLKSIDAPKIMITNLEKKINNLKKGLFKAKGLEDLGSFKVNKHNVRKGRGGKQFFEFDTKEGIVYYFPLGQYGPFLKRK